MNNDVVNQFETEEEIVEIEVTELELHEDLTFCSFPSIPGFSFPGSPQ